MDQGSIHMIRGNRRVGHGRGALNDDSVGGRQGIVAMGQDSRLMIYVNRVLNHVNGAINYRFFGYLGKIRGFLLYPYDPDDRHVCRTGFRSGARHATRGLGRVAHR
jgi:hypothetical protein